MRSKFIFAVVVASVISSCGNENSSSYSGSSYEKTETINGVYTYTESGFKTSITISGSRWTGRTTLYGSTTYENGIVDGKDLYDDSGFAKVGYVNNGRITTSMGGKRVTLEK